MMCMWYPIQSNWLLPIELNEKVSEESSYEKASFISW